MSGIGIVTVKEAVSGVFTVIKVGIKTVKNLANIKKELGDLDGAEITALATQIVVEELPPLWTEIKK